MSMFRFFTILLIVFGLVYFLTQRDDHSFPENDLSEQRETTQKIRSGKVLEIKENRESDPQEIQKRIEEEWRAQDFEAVSAFFRGWISFDPDGAISYVSEMSAPMEPIHFGPEIKAYLETLSPDQAMMQSLKLSNDPQLQESVTADLFAKWLEDDFNASKAWLFEHSERLFVLALAERMGRLGNFGDPKEALQWMVNSPEGEFRSKLVKGVVLRWLRSDQEIAIEHLNTLPPSPAFDEATMSYATGLSRDNPVIAMMWADTIESESLRSMIVSEIQWGWSEDHTRKYLELIGEE